MTKTRKTGQENIFSAIHRKLDANILMTDIDYHEGKIERNGEYIAVTAETENELFAEYRLSNYKAKTIALYDYKFTLSEYIRKELSQLKVGTSLWYHAEMARQLNARAFAVCADYGELPLTFIEITKGRPQIVGVLKSGDKEAVRSFWKNVLKIS